MMFSLNTLCWQWSSLFGNLSWVSFFCMNSASLVGRYWSTGWYFWYVYLSHTVFGTPVHALMLICNVHMSWLIQAQTDLRPLFPGSHWVMPGSDAEALQIGATPWSMKAQGAHKDIMIFIVSAPCQWLHWWEWQTQWPGTRDIQLSHHWHG